MGGGPGWEECGEEETGCGEEETGYRKEKTGCGEQKKVYFGANVVKALSLKRH